jgi:hypothetical protein
MPFKSIILEQTQEGSLAIPIVSAGNPCGAFPGKKYCFSVQQPGTEELYFNSFNSFEISNWISVLQNGGVALPYVVPQVTNNPNPVQDFQGPGMGWEESKLQYRESEFYVSYASNFNYRQYYLHPMITGKPQSLSNINQYHLSYFLILIFIIILFFRSARYQYNPRSYEFQALPNAPLGESISSFHFPKFPYPRFR